MEDYSVLEAADAAQCRYMLSNNDVDLVILDIMLPDGDGISLCREIKAKYDIPSPSGSIISSITRSTSLFDSI